MRSLLDRLRRLPVRTVDRLLVIALLLIAVGSTADQSSVGTAVGALNIVSAAITALAALGRRRHPVIALAIALGAFLIDLLLGGSSENSGSLVSLMVLAYSVGRHGDTRSLPRAAAVAVPVFTINAAFYSVDGFVNELAFDLLVATVLPIVAGTVLRRRADLVAELVAQRGELERERDARIHDAAIAERVRIARELHDVVVHDVSEMVVQAAAAREIVRAQPGEAADAIARVEGAGRGALNELRRALGVLRVDDRAMALDPQPTLAGLRALIGDARAQLALDVDPALAQVPADIQLTAYRIVEDVLADGAGDVTRGTVRLAEVDGAVSVDIRHDGPPPAAAGLGATRQRVEMLDGTLDVTGASGAGSRVCALLPLPIPASG